MVEILEKIYMGMMLAMRCHHRLRLRLGRRNAGLAGISALLSPDLDAYASGQLDASAIRCALCQQAPCTCPPFGTPEYFALLDARHGRKGQ